MIFLSAQHISIYYLWQMRVCIANLSSNGISKDEIHALFVTYPHQKISNDEQELLDILLVSANIFIYEDTRISKNYPSSVRPHVLAKHFRVYPYLEKQKIFYHDCDIYFRELPPLLKMPEDGVWYVSNTSGYLSSDYIKVHIGEENFERMCAIVGVKPDTVIEQDTNCGGAQYIMQGVTAAFWKKVEIDSEKIHRFLGHVNKGQLVYAALTNKRLEYKKGIQKWCADMWSILWNAILWEYRVKVHTDLDFCWPKSSINEWNKNYILHNAGVEQKEAEQYFYKGNYLYHTPFFESFNYVSRNNCSSIYVDAVKALSSNNRLFQLLDVTFLIPVMIDSEDRLDNIYASVSYLQKHFDTHIIILEYGKKQVVKKEAFPKNVTLLWEEGDEKIFHHTWCNNQLVDVATTPFIAIYDTDVIVPIAQMLEAVNLLRFEQAQMVYPYDGRFVGLDKLSSVIFSKFLSDHFLKENNEKFILSSRRSFGGCVFLNRQAFILAGKDNEKFTSWGPEDIERYMRMKILGYAVKRIEGPLYHMHHERGKNSGYRDIKKHISFMEEYTRIFNKTKKELEQYIVNWQYKKSSVLHNG